MYMSLVIMSLINKIYVFGLISLHKNSVQQLYSWWLYLVTILITFISSALSKIACKIFPSY